MQQSSEHSVEDILETIKRVIARDNRESAQAERARRETAGVVDREERPAFRLVPAPIANDPGEEAEVLDLRETSVPVFDADEPLELGVEQAEGALEAEAEYDLEAALMVEEDVLELAEAPAAELPEAAATPEPEPVAEPVPVAASAPESQGEQPLASEDTAHSVRQSLAALALLAGQGEDGDGPDRMIAEMAREMLRPMLAQWLDENLPDMVERLVKAEIGRLTGLSR